MTNLSDLTRRFGKRGVLDIMATVGMYTALSFIVNTFQTALDPDVAQIFSGEPLPAGSQSPRPYCRTER